MTIGFALQTIGLFGRVTIAGYQVYVARYRVESFFV